MLSQRPKKHSCLRFIGSTIWCKTSLASSLHINPVGNFLLAFPTMVVLSEVVHPRGLGFPAQKQVYVLRKVDKLSWPKIAAKVLNLQGTHPDWRVCRDAFRQMSTQTGKAHYKYDKCGRKKTLTKPLRSWLLKRLCSLRKRILCTSILLQQELAQKKQVKVHATTIRKMLHEEGFRWAPRGKKPKYNEQVKAERWAFAKWILRIPPSYLGNKINFSFDGVILTKPPEESTSRENYCRTGENSIWRKPEERCFPELDGWDKYSKQAPPSRVLPLWAGIGKSGVADVFWHEHRKTNAVEWAESVDTGILEEGLHKANQRRCSGPWKILCDNESFLRADISAAAHRRWRVGLIKLPAKSPDLNPVEMFWAWLRKRLRALDLDDFVKRRPVPGKEAYRVRVRRVLRSRQAQDVASKCFASLHKTAVEVDANEGGASRH